MSERTEELRRLIVRTAKSESQMLAWLAEFEDRVRAEAAPPPLDGLDVERLSVAMNRATVYGKGTAEEVAREYAALRAGETPDPTDAIDAWRRGRNER